MNYLIKNKPLGLNNWLCKKICLVVLILVSSEQLTAKEIDLATAIELMLEQNNSLKVFDFKRREIDGANYTARLNPEFEVGFEVENVLGSKPYTAFKQGELTVSLSSVIELGGKKDARTSFALMKYELLEAQKKMKSLELISEITGLYIEALATQELIKLANDSVLLSEDIYETVKRKALAGAISDVEVKRSYAYLKQAQNTLLVEQSKLDRQLVNLSLYWGEKSPHFNQLSGALFEFGTVKELKELYEILEQSSYLQVIAMNQSMAESKLKVIQAESKTNINWNLGIRRFEESNDAAITAGFSLPLFKNTRNKGELVQAEANVDSYNTEHQDALLKLYGQVYEYYSLRETSIERLKSLENEIIPALTDALELTRVAYLDGRYGYLEYSAARADLIQSKKSLIETAKNILKYGIQMERITAGSIYVDRSLNQGDES